MKDTYYFYGQTTDNQRFAVAARMYEENTYILGISLCSLKDNFNKKLGRTIAEGRVERWINSSTPKNCKGNRLLSNIKNIGELHYTTALLNLINSSKLKNEFYL
jgi:hypothetical protein